MLNIDDPNDKPTSAAIWQLGFRPFFFFGALFAALAIPIWLVTLYAPQYTWLTAPSLWWHPHELLFGFAIAIITGFLLTAVKNWTGKDTYSGTSLAIVFSFWLAARITLMLPIPAPIELAAFFDFVFMVLVIGKLWQCIYGVRQWRNIVIPIGLTIALCLNLLSYWAVISQDYLLASNIWLAMLFMVALLISFIGGRVIPFFTSAKLKIERQDPILLLDVIAFASLFLLVLISLTGELNNLGSRAILFIAGISSLARMMRWQPKASLKEPMLWSLHLSYLCLPITLIVLAVMEPTQFVVKNMMHFFAIGTLAGVCLSMITRVSLGHTGRSIYKGPDMTGPFIYIMMAAVTRAVFPIVMPESITEWHFLSGILWSVAFLHFVFKFAKFLFSYRPDGRPG